MQISAEDWFYDEEWFYSLWAVDSCNTRNTESNKKLTVPHPQQLLSSYYPPRINEFRCICCCCCLQRTETLFLSSLPISVVVILSLWHLTHCFPSFPVWYCWRFSCRSCWRIKNLTLSFFVCGLSQISRQTHFVKPKQLSRRGDWTVTENGNLLHLNFKMQQLSWIYTHEFIYFRCTWRLEVVIYGHVRFFSFIMHNYKSQFMVTDTVDILREAEEP